MKADPPVPAESPADIARAANGRPGYGLGAFLVLAVVALAWANILFAPLKALPVQVGNGTYMNPCCAPLTLQDGQAHSADVLFKYVIEPGKAARRLRLDKQAVVIEADHLRIVDAKAGVSMPLAAGDPPIWLEIDGRRFVRRTEPH